MNIFKFLSIKIIINYNMKNLKVVYSKYIFISNEINFAFKEIEFDNKIISISAKTKIDSIKIFSPINKTKNILIKENSSNVNKDKLNSLLIELNKIKQICNAEKA